jgi:hypothetical protein
VSGKKTLVLMDFDYNDKISWYSNTTDHFKFKFFGLNFNNFFKKYFNFEIYDEQKTYDKDCIFVILDIYNKKKFSDRYPTYLKLHDQGYKIILWMLPEFPGTHFHRFFNPLNSPIPIFYIPHWFWFQELGSSVDPFLSTSEKIVLTPHEYPKNKTYEALALVPMNKPRNHRDQLFNRLSSLKNDILLSYVARGLTLPRNELYESDINPYYVRVIDPLVDPGVEIINDRYFNPDWYNSTYFSIVVETCIEKYEYPVFLTEKTWKPIKYKHPFVIWGQPGSLAYLKELGFETYENLFDESYDLNENPHQRLQTIISNVKNFRKQYYRRHTAPITYYRSNIYKKQTYDKLTQDKIEYNYNLFFNSGILNERLYTDIVVPMYKFSDSK